MLLYRVPCSIAVGLPLKLTVSGAAVHVKPMTATVSRTATASNPSTMSVILDLDPPQCSRQVPAQQQSVFPDLGTTDVVGVTITVLMTLLSSTAPARHTARPFTATSPQLTTSDIIYTSPTSLET